MQTILKSSIPDNLQEAIKQAGDNRVVLTTQGMPKIGILPDLSHIHDVTLSVPSRKSDNSQSQTCDKNGRAPVMIYPPSYIKASRNGGLAGLENGNTILMVLYRLIKLLGQHGCDDSIIIQKGLGCSGKKLEWGAKTIQSIRELGNQNNW